MPEFILPAEADRCPHCGEVLYDPPNCCETMKADYQADIDREHREAFEANRGDPADDQHDDDIYQGPGEYPGREE